jgi:hypothetical protein
MYVQIHFFVIVIRLIFMTHAQGCKVKVWIICRKKTGERTDVEKGEENKK